MKPGVDARIEQARDHYNAGRYCQAHEACAAVLHQCPGHGEGLMIGGLSLAALDCANAAAALLEAAARRRGQDTRTWRFLGAALRDIDPRGALDAFERAAALAPRDPELLAEYAAAAYRAADPQRALPVVERALAASPDAAPLTLLMAKALHDSRRLDDAEPYYRAALAARPDDPSYRWEYAMQLLLTGRFDKGWDHYDARVAAHGWQVSQYPFSLSPWTGGPLRDRTLLVHGEQGLGDEIMFYSIVPELAAEAGRVIVACSPTLADLMRHSFPAVTVKSFPRDPEAVACWRAGAPPPPWTAQFGPIDYHCPAGSLARYRRRKMADFVQRPAYLSAPPGLSDCFERLLRERIERYDATFKIGLAWLGNPKTGAMGLGKSIPVEALAPLAGQHGVCFVGLHPAGHAGETPTVHGLPYVDLGGQLETIGHTAGLIDNLDLVISVDTVTAHLAGSMGTETWVALRVRADWRYLEVGTRGIWYPDMRLFRQRTEGDWGPVINDLCRALQRRVEA